MLVGRGWLPAPASTAECHLCIYLPCSARDEDNQDLSILWFKYLQSSEEPQGLSLWVQELSVAWSGPRTPPGQMLSPGSFVEGETLYLELT